MIRARDLAERFFWTIVAAALTNLVGVGVLDLDLLQAAALSGINGGATFLLVLARWRLAVLPNPGDGLPGLPTTTDDGVTTLEAALIVGLFSFAAATAVLIALA